MWHLAAAYVEKGCGESLAPIEQVDLILHEWREMLDGVRDDLVDLAYVTASYTPARFLLTKMGELPGGGATATINSILPRLIAA